MFKDFLTVLLKTRYHEVDKTLACDHSNESY